MTLADRITALATGIGNYIRDSIKPRLLPSGGATGTVLGKSSATDYAVAWITPSAGAGGSTGQVQYNASGVLTGAANLTIDNGDLSFSNQASPAISLVGKSKVFGYSKAKRQFLGVIGSKDKFHLLQPSIIDKNISLWIPPGSSTTVPGVFGMTAPAALGTVTTRAITTTNYSSRQKCLGYNSAATAGSFAGHYSTAAQYTVGDGSGNGGFYYNCIFKTNDGVVNGTRMFIGLSSSVGTPTNVEPNTIKNAIGIAILSTDGTQLYLVYGGSSAQTAIPLGTTFSPYTSTFGPVYSLHLYAPSGENGVIYYQVERMDTGDVVEGALTPSVVGTQTPSSSTLLAHRAWKCNNALVQAVQIDIGKIYIETN